MHNPIKKLTQRHKDAVSMMVSGMTGRKIAETLGVDQATVSEWKTSPIFMQAYREAVQELIKEREELIRALQQQSLKHLYSAVMNPDTSPASVSAAKHATRMLLPDAMHLQAKVAEESLDLTNREQVLELLSNIPEDLLKEALANKSKE